MRVRVAVSEWGWIPSIEHANIVGLREGKIPAMELGSQSSPSGGNPTSERRTWLCCNVWGYNVIPLLK